MRPLLTALVLIVGFPVIAHADYFDLARQEQRAKQQQEKAKEAAESAQFDQEWSNKLLQAAQRVIAKHGLSGELKQGARESWKAGAGRIDQVTFSTRDNYECAGDHGMPWGGNWHGAFVHCINAVTGKHLEVFVGFSKR